MIPIEFSAEEAAQVRAALVSSLDLLPSSGQGQRARSACEAALQILDPAERVVHEVALTPQESRVLELIADGYSNAEIARQTHMSINTLKTYVRSSYRKLGVSRRTQAVAWVLRHRGQHEPAPALEDGAQLT